MQLTDYFTISASILYINFLSMVLRPVFRSLLSPSFEITHRHSTLGGIIRTSDQSLRSLPDNHNIHKRQTSMPSVGFQPQSQQANGRRTMTQTGRPQALVSQLHIYFIWQFTAPRSYRSNIIKHKTEKPISNTHRYITEHEKIILCSILYDL